MNDLFQTERDANLFWVGWFSALGFVCLIGFICSSVCVVRRRES